MADRERLLVDFALAIASAKDSADGLLALRAYLVSRLSPAAYKVLEEAEIEMAEGCLYKAEGSKYTFILPLPVPQYVVIQDPSRTFLDSYEEEAVGRLLLAFRERYIDFKELKGLTFTDDITGLYNQRYLELVLDREFALAKRSQCSFSVLFLDLDHFKNINDTHGHLIGSKLLHEVGDVIKRTLRESDVTFRYGGDEFVMVLGNTSLKDAMMVAERVRQQIEKKRFLARDKMDIRLTASIGVATFPEHGASKKDILRAADAAMYGVKRQHRNKVLAAEFIGK